METYFHDLPLSPHSHYTGAHPGTKGSRGAPSPRSYVNAERMSNVANDEMYMTDDEIEDKNDDMGVKTDWENKFAPAKGIISQYSEIKKLVQRELRSALTGAIDAEYDGHINQIVSEIMAAGGTMGASTANTVASGSIMGAPGQMAPVGKWVWGDEGKNKKKKRKKGRSPLHIG